MLVRLRSDRVDAWGQVHRAGSIVNLGRGEALARIKRGDAEAVDEVERADVDPEVETATKPTSKPKRARRARGKKEKD